MTSTGDTSALVALVVITLVMMLVPAVAIWLTARRQKRDNLLYIAQVWDEYDRDVLKHEAFMLTWRPEKPIPRPKRRPLLGSRQRWTMPPREVPKPRTPKPPPMKPCRPVVGPRPLPVGIR